MRIHHVQVAIPAGGEDEGRRFYRDGLGMTEIAKPPALAARGGVWFRTGEAEIHLGVETDPQAARKAHPALQVETVAELERLADRLTAAGFAVDWSQRRNVGRFERFHVCDPFGNRLELLVTDQ